MAWRQSEQSVRQQDTVSPMYSYKFGTASRAENQPTEISYSQIIFNSIEFYLYNSKSQHTLSQGT